jgi:hypothetical protein
LLFLRVGLLRQICLGFHQTRVNLVPLIPLSFYNIASDLQQ